MRCISKPLRRTISTSHSSRFARLELELFSPPSQILTFFRFIKNNVKYAAFKAKIFFRPESAKKTKMSYRPAAHGVKPKPRGKERKARFPGALIRRAEKNQSKTPVHGIDRIDQVDLRNVKKAVEALIPFSPWPPSDPRRYEAASPPKPENPTHFGESRPLAPPLAHGNLRPTGRRREYRERCGLPWIKGHVMPRAMGGGAPRRPFNSEWV